MLKKDLLAGSTGESFVGVYHYKITPVHWTTFENYTDNNNYGFTNTSAYGNHGSAELLDSSGETFHLSSFFYKDLKIKSFDCSSEAESKTVNTGFISINNGETMPLEGFWKLPEKNEDGTWVPPHDIIRPACESGNPFDLRLYVLSFSVMAEDS